jgi:uncharacterized membrane protein YraQ (UPF0718 family)
MFDAFASLLVDHGMRLDPTSQAGAALRFFVTDATKIFALAVLVIYGMGLLRALRSPERLGDFVRNRPDWQARSLAVGTTLALMMSVAALSVPEMLIPRKVVK